MCPSRGRFLRPSDQWVRSSRLDCIQTDPDAIHWVGKILAGDQKYLWLPAVFRWWICTTIAISNKFKKIIKSQELWKNYVILKTEFLRLKSNYYKMSRKHLMKHYHKLCHPNLELTWRQILVSFKLCKSFDFIYC